MYRFFVFINALNLVCSIVYHSYYGIMVLQTKKGEMMGKIVNRVEGIPEGFFPISMARAAILMKLSYYRVRKSALTILPNRPAYCGIMKDEALKIAELIEARPVGGKAVRKMGASFYVAIPPSWVRFNSLDKGGRVYIHVSDAGVLEIRTAPEESGEI